MSESVNKQMPEKGSLLPWPATTRTVPEPEFSPTIQKLQRQIKQEELEKLHKRQRQVMANREGSYVVKQRNMY